MRFIFLSVWYPELPSNNRQIKIHVYAKLQTWICTTWPSFSPYFPFTVYCFYTKISSFMPALSIRIALDCFYLLIFYSEKFSTDVCRLPYAVNVNLNLSIVATKLQLKIVKKKNSLFLCWKNIFYSKVKKPDSWTTFSRFDRSFRLVQSYHISNRHLYGIFNSTKP